VGNAVPKPGELVSEMDKLHMAIMNNPAGGATEMSTAISTSGYHLFQKGANQYSGALSRTGLFNSPIFPLQTLEKRAGRTRTGELEADVRMGRED